MARRNPSPADAAFILARLAEARRPRAVGDVVRSYDLRSNVTITAIDGDIVTTSDGRSFHVTKCRNAA